MWNYTDMLLKQIGQNIVAECTWHHTTILYGSSSIQNIIDTRDPIYYPMVQAAAAKLGITL